MARKDLLKGLIEGGTGSKSDPPAPRPRYTKGAIGAVGQSIAELKSRALEEVPADLIDPAGLTDRLGEDPAGFEALKASIRDYGQQVPVLLRHDPNVEGRYQVVYGRRRVAALRALNMPVKAMIRDLNDRDLIVAQGQENSARRDLTFIEKANFARQMVDMGFERKVVCDALHIDKTVISRMLSVTEAVPLDLITRIGPAPSAGRDRWLKLAKALETARGNGSDLPLGAETSDGRFEEALARFSARPPTPAKRAEVALRSGPAKLGSARKTANSTVFTLDSKVSDGFDDWLIDNIEEIHRHFQKSRGE